MAPPTTADPASGPGMTEEPRNMTKSTVACWLFAGVIAGGGAFAIGCTQDSTPAPTERVAASELKDGITILSADAQYGISAAFKQAGRVIYLETRMGDVKPEGYRSNYPDEPMREMDARFVDQVGHTFKLQIGGDGLIDPAWSDDIAKGKLAKDSVTKADRELDFVLARDAANALAKVAGPELRDHVYHLVNMGNIVPREQADLVADEASFGAPNASNTPTVTDEGSDIVGRDSSCYWNYIEAQAWSKCVALCVGRHSAVRAYNYSNCTGTWDAQVFSCNHGTCANDMGTYNNKTNSGWIPNYKDLHNAWNIDTRRDLADKSAQTNQGCYSSYNWSTPSGHLCNSDTAYEMFQIFDAASYAKGSSSRGDATNFTWRDPGGNNYNCAATSSTDCSGDWSVPRTPGWR
jgi:hypothetical protein